jgi:Integrase core domain
MAHRGCSQPTSRSDPASVARAAGDRPSSPARPALPTRPSGKCCAGTASRAGRQPPREPANSYEWPCPGDLLHMDVQPLRPLRTARPPGHRRATGCGPRRGSATTTRTRSSTTTPGSPTPSCTKTRRRHRHRLRRMGAHLLCRAWDRHEAPDDRQRLQLRQEPLAARTPWAPRHPPLTTEPYRPRTNGKVERFHQTMAHEWAYGLAYNSHRHRNQRTATPGSPLQPPGDPHSSIGDRPPISRVHNVRGWDT